MMNRFTIVGLSLPALLISSIAVAGEPPFPAPRAVPVQTVDEDRLREQLREDIRQEVDDQVQRERDALRAEQDRLAAERDRIERDRIERERQAMEEDDRFQDREVVIIDRGVQIPSPAPQMVQHSLAVGAGALGFIDTGLDPVGSAAPTWHLRYGYTPIAPLTWELGYVGAVRVEDSETNLTATLFETGLKLNTIPDSVVYPIIMAGIGYGAWTNPADDLDDLATLTIPLGVGVEVATGNFLISGRGIYRPVFGDGDINFTGAGADNWTLTADVGYRF